MGLRLLTGRAGTGKTQRCITEIQEQLKLSHEGSPLVLILPEQAIFQVEKALISGGIQGFFRAHVVGFCRLAYKVLTETGGLVYPQLTGFGKRLVIQRILLEQQEKLEVFGQVARQKGFAKIAAGMLKEFKSYDILPKQLESAKDFIATDNIALGKKVNDLALIYHSFEEFLAGRYIDSEDYLSMFVSRLSRSKLLSGAEIWIDGFTWFTPQEYKVLEELLKTAQQVTITLCIASQAESGGKSAFERQNAARQKLLELAAKNKVDAAEEELKIFWRFTGNPLLGHIEQQLTARPICKWPGPPEGLTIAEGASRLAEAQGIARDIIRLCRDKGYRFRDIAILIRGYDSYNGILDMALADNAIPYFTDGQRIAAIHPVAELLRSAVEVAGGRWNYDTVFRCLKTELFPLTRDEIDVFENYVLEFGIRGSRWTTEEPWRFQRRISLEAEQEATEEDCLILEQVNRARRIVVRPLAVLAEKLKQAPTASLLCCALYEFLEEMKTADKMEEWARAAESCKELAQAKEHRRILKQITELFEQIADTFGGQELDFESFAGFLNEGLEALEVSSIIPPGLDYVTVAPLEKNRLNKVKAVYISGVNDGILPRQRDGDGLLSEAERNRLAACGIELPSASNKVFEEQYLIYSSLALASEYLWVSYAAADEEGNSLLPSYIIKRLREITGAKVKILESEPSQGNELEYLAEPRSSFAYLAVMLREYSQGRQIAALWWDVYNWALAKPHFKEMLKQALAGLFFTGGNELLPKEIARQLYQSKTRLFGSITRFENYMACPFRHFARYGLKLQERTVFQLRPPDFGQFLHAIVKEFGEQLQILGRDWGSVEQRECEKLCDEIIDRLVLKLQNEILLSSGQYQHLAGRLRNTAKTVLWRLVEFGQVTEFMPYGYEIPFDDISGQLPALRHLLQDGTELCLVGKIDRLDTVVSDGRIYILIIDYKAGGTWLKLSEVAYGLKLQLLTYLLAACGGEKLFLGQESCPAGVLYYFLKKPQVVKNSFVPRAEVLEELNNRLKLPGWTLDDNSIIVLLDSQFARKSKFFKLARKKDGSYTAGSRTYLKNVEEFNLLMKYTERQLVKAAEGILSGDVRIRPYIMGAETACDKCMYRPVCRFDVRLSGNEYRKLSKIKDAEALKLIEEEVLGL